MALNEMDFRGVSVSTQEKVTEGTPDIVVVGPNLKIIVEVKVESDTDLDQLKRYRSHLDGVDAKRRFLTVLTKYRQDRAWLEGTVDAAVRWHEVSHVLRGDLENMKDEVSRYLIQQFLVLLAARGMVMEKVSWELTQGVRALSCLLEMLCDAIGQYQDKAKSFAGTTNYAFQYFWVAGTECGAGIYFERPNVVVYEAYNVDKRRADALGIGRVDKKVKQSNWVNELDLDSEGVHFFASSLARQVEQLSEFIKSSTQAVRTISTVPKPTAK